MLCCAHPNLKPKQLKVYLWAAQCTADLQPTDTVLDLFCGAGAISLVLAQHCQSVTGVESNAAAVADAKRNAALNGVSNASFWCHDLNSFQAVGTVFAQRPGIDVVVAGTILASLSPAAFSGQCSVCRYERPCSGQGNHAAGWLTAVLELI